MLRHRTRPRRRPRVAAPAALAALLLGLLVPLAPAPQAHASVPSPSGNQAVVNVSVGGARLANGGIAPLAGVQLRLHYDSNGSIGSAVTLSWGRCTSDADGDCSFVVPNANNTNNRMFWVVGESAPAGWSFNDEVRTGNSMGTTNAATPYAFRTPTLQRGQTYRSGDDFMSGTASSGFWQLSRPNPSLDEACGIDVAFVIDYSGSMSAQVDNMVRAVGSFVNDLVGTPSRASFVSFGTASPANGLPVGSSTAQAIPNRTTMASVSTQAGADAFIGTFASGSSPNYASRWRTNNEGTNWDAALRAVANANSGANAADLVVLLTDGNPTYNLASNGQLQGSGTTNTIRDVEAAVHTANRVRDQGTRIVALGVGSGAASTETRLNLAAVSGPTMGADHHQVSTFEQAGAVLRGLTPSTCAGTLTVTKMLVPDGGTTADAVAGQGWTFAASAQSTNVQVSTPTSRTTGANGQASFPLTITDHRTAAVVRAVETAQSGYSLLQVGGANAQCRRGSDGAAVTVTNVTNGFQVPVRSSDSVACTVYNQAAPSPATLQVDKRWIVDGTAYAHGAQPSWLSATPTISGRTTSAFGTAYSGYVRGGTVTIGESVGAMPADRPGCTVTGRTVTSVNGATTSTALGTGYALTLVAGANRVTITNAVTCAATLTLAKEVEHGTAAPGDFTLRAAGPTTVSGAGGAAAVTARSVTAGATYVLSETGPAAYVQRGQWACVALRADGQAATTSWTDAADDRVAVPAGMHVRCTATNATASLVLLERIEGTAMLSPAQFQLTATPATLAGLAPTTVGGGLDATAAATVEVRPGHAYALTSASDAAHLALRVERYTGTPGPGGAVDHDDPSLWTAIDPAAVAVAAAGTTIVRFVATAPTPFDLPITGGVGIDHVQLVGGGLLALALLTGLAVLHHRRRRA